MEHSIRKFMRIVEQASECGELDDEHDDLSENGGRIVKGVNTTCDVPADGIKKEAAKFGNVTDEDGVPPLIYEEPAGLPQKSERSPVARPGDPDLPTPLKALFSRRRRRR